MKPFFFTVAPSQCVFVTKIRYSDGGQQFRCVTLLHVLMRAKMLGEGFIIFPHGIALGTEEIA